MRYRYFIDSNKNTICISTYAGKTVKGIAKCNLDNDKFDESCGKKLAKARCDFKVAMRRKRREFEKYNEAVKSAETAKKILAKRYLALDAACKEFDFTYDQLKEIEQNLR